jgi:hypothetical protein
MKYIILIWAFIFLIILCLNIGKKIYHKELKEKLTKKNDEQILDFIYNNFNL